MKKTSLSDLRDHIFEVIERLKLSNDPDADPKEKIDIDTAQTISNLAQVAVNSAKVEVEAIKIISRSDNPQATKEAIKNSDVLRLNDKNE